MFGPRHAVSAVLDLEFDDGTHRQVVTDRTWKTTTGPMAGRRSTAGRRLGFASRACRVEHGRLRARRVDAGGRAARPAGARFSAYPGEPVRVMRVAARAGGDRAAAGRPRHRLRPEPRRLGALPCQRPAWPEAGAPPRRDAQRGRHGLHREPPQRPCHRRLLPEGRRRRRWSRCSRSTDSATPRSRGSRRRPPRRPGRRVVVHSDLRETGTFASSHELVNQIFANTLWGQRGNYVDVPTDCPQRDERMGWMGDAQVFARTAALQHGRRRRS